MIDIKGALRVRAAYVAELRWRNLFGVFLVGFPTFLACMILIAGVGMLRTAKSGIEGTVWITDCHSYPTRGRPDWSCTGRFQSRDGRILINSIELYKQFDEDQRAPAGPLRTYPARVTGPDASETQPKDPAWPAALAMGVFLLAVACWMFWQWVTPPPDGPLTAKQRRLRHRAESQRRREADARRSAPPQDRRSRTR